MTVDSGACDTVMPVSSLCSFKMLPSYQSLNEMEYEVANGESVPNLDERRCEVRTTGSLAPKLIIFQIADVSRPLISVAKLTESGKAVIFGCSGGVIRDLATGHDTPFERRDGIYIFKMKIPPPEAVNPESGFARRP